MHTRPLLLTSVLLLAACSALPKGDVSFQDMIKNPLFAQNYYSDLTEHFVNLQIHNDPSMSDAAMKKIADSARAEALAKAQEASTIVNAGIHGDFIGAGEEVRGIALLADGNLYFGPDFMVIPAGELHVYTTLSADPRDGTFPGEQDTDVGPVKLAYGAQTYVLPPVTEKPGQMTVVLYDKMLKRIHAFAQLR